MKTILDGMRNDELKLLIETIQNDTSEMWKSVMNAFRGIKIYEIGCMGNGCNANAVWMVIGEATYYNAVAITKKGIEQMGEKLIKSKSQICNISI